MVHDPDGHVADASASPASVTPEQRLSYTPGAVGGMFQRPHTEPRIAPYADAHGIRRRRTKHPITATAESKIS